MTDEELDELEERLPRTVAVARGALGPEEMGDFLAWLRRVKFAQVRPQICEAAAAMITGTYHVEIEGLSELRSRFLNFCLATARLELEQLDQDALLLEAHAPEQGGRDELVGIVEQLETALGTKSPTVDRGASGRSDRDARPSLVVEVRWPDAEQRQTDRPDGGPAKAPLEPPPVIKAPRTDDVNVCREARGGQNQAPPERPLVIQARRSDLDDALRTESETGVPPKRKEIRVRVGGAEEGTITYGWWILLRRLETPRTLHTVSDRSEDHSSLRRLKDRANPWGLRLDCKGLVWTCGPFALETYEPGGLEREAERKKKIEAELHKDRHGLV